MQSTFVKDVRKLRKKEMQQYEDKGYTILNKANYVFNDTINIEIDKEIFSFGIRVNNNANSFLETLGWIFDANLGRYILQKEKLVGERNRKRYYLTAAEERIIP